MVGFLLFSPKWLVSFLFPFETNAEMGFPKKADPCASGVLVVFIYCVFCRLFYFCCFF